MSFTRRPSSTRSENFLIIFFSVQLIHKQVHPDRCRWSESGVVQLPPVRNTHKTRNATNSFSCQNSNQNFNPTMSAAAPSKVSVFPRPLFPIRPIIERPSFESGKPVCASGATPRQGTSRVQQPDGTWTSVVTGAWTCGSSSSFFHPR
jgi:hypothetical protein